MAEIDIRRELTEYSASQLVEAVYRDISPEERNLDIQAIVDGPYSLEARYTQHLIGQKFFLKKFDLAPLATIKEDTDEVQLRLLKRTEVEVNFFEDPIELVAAVGRILIKEYSN